MVLFGWAAFYEHDDISREIALDVIEALRQSGISQFAASQYMYGDLKHETQLSRQLAGVQPLNLYRLFRLPPSFQFCFLKLRAKRLGADVIEPGIIQELLAHLRALVPGEKKESEAA
jgi:hypothetical protein